MPMLEPMHSAAIAVRGEGRYRALETMVDLRFVARERIADLLSARDGQERQVRFVFPGPGRATRGRRPTATPS
jgi:hypothetical protein